MRNIFLEKSYTKCDGETSPRPFYKKSKFSISLCFYYVLGLPNYIKTKVLPLALTLYKAFVKNKKGVELVSLPHFLHGFRRRIFIMLYLLTDQISLSDFFTLRY